MMGTNVYTEPFDCEELKNFDFEHWVFLLFILALWPPFLLLYLIMEEYIHFHKPITFGKKKQNSND